MKQVLNGQLVCTTLESYRETRTVRTDYVDPIYTDLELIVKRNHPAVTPQNWTYTQYDVKGMRSDKRSCIVGTYEVCHGPDGMFTESWSFHGGIAVTVYPS